MKIAITGCNHGLGRGVAEYLTPYHSLVCLEDRIETYPSRILKLIDDCDVFINCAYKDKIQVDLLDEVYGEWKYKKKTIINILTSAIFFDSPNKEYVNNKEALNSSAFTKYSSDKTVRIINIYPNTLENTKNIPLQKLQFNDVAKVIKYAIELPQDIELFSIGLQKTTKDIPHSIL